MKPKGMKQRNWFRCAGCGRKRRINKLAEVSGKERHDGRLLVCTVLINEMRVAKVTCTQLARSSNAE